MFKSSSLLFDDSIPWNPYCVRNFLNIPEDQLNLMSNIPEWSVINEPTGTSINASDSEYQSALKDSKQKLHVSEKLFQNEKNVLMLDDSFEIQREICEAVSKKRNIISRSLSLCNINEFKKHSEYKSMLKRSSSAPSIHHKISSKISSVLNSIKSKFCILESSYILSNEKRFLNETYTVSSVLNSNSEFSGTEKIMDQTKLGKNLNILSENTVCTNNMSDNKITEGNSVVNNHSNQISTESPVCRCNPSEVTDGNQSKTSLSDPFTREISSLSKEHNRHSCILLEDKDLSQKENIGVSDESQMKKTPYETSSQNVLEESNNKKNAQGPTKSVFEVPLVHHSQSALKSVESMEEKVDKCVENASKIYFEESICSQSIPCGQKPTDSANTNHTLIEVDQEDLANIPSNLDAHAPCNLQSSESQKISVVSTEKITPNHTLACSGKSDKRPKSTQKKRKNSHGKQIKGMPSVKYARKADEISFSNSQFEKMLDLMKKYIYSK